MARDGSCSERWLRLGAAVLPVALVAAALLAGGCTHTPAQEPETAPPDLGARLNELASAIETLDADAILAVYAGDVYSLSWNLPYKADTGAGSHEESLRRFLEEVEDVQISLAPETTVERRGDKAWSTRYFEAKGKLKDGQLIDIAGWHSAVWTDQMGPWRIEYEHFQAAVDTTTPPPPVVAVVPTPKPTPPPDVLKDIFFDLDKYNIRPDQVPTITANAEWLLANPEYDVLIEGHCDERATNAYNMVLGRRRAESARDFLIDKGVDPERITIVSKGEEAPFVQGKGEKYWSKNRRAHFIVTGD